MISKAQRLLLAGTALAGASSAHAEPAADLAAEIQALRAEVAELRNRVTELESGRVAETAIVPQAAQVQLAIMTTAQPQPATPPARESGPEIRFSGAPTITAPRGWSFKPRGRLQYDVGHVSSPDGVGNPGLGFGNEVRRARLGVEGTIPGGFGYTFEIDFADNKVEIVDAFLNYRASSAVSLTVGQHNNFQSLEELSSSRFSSFIERAAFTDAFNFERRVGISGTFTGGDFIAQAGIFTDNVNDLGSDANNALGLDGRLVYAPELGDDTRLHLGASAHWRDTGDLARNGVRYRQRPLVHTTDVRFLATPSLTVDSETDFGLEAALIHGPFHAVGETHWFESDTAFTGSDPTFFGAYAELGWFLTGETRGYRNGRWDRTRVRRPVGGSDGGFGALQVNLRYDHLDLTSGGVVGGTQNGLQASLIWIPQDYVRFMINYGHLIYDDAAILAAGGDRDYSIEVIGARAQIDF